jgi:ankyrin repeat protein
MRNKIVDYRQNPYSELLDIAQSRLMLEKDLVIQSNIDIRDKQGRNALYWTIKLLHKHNTNLLIKHGISLMVEPKKHALFHTIRSKNLDLFSQLITSGENINMLNEDNQSLLMVAIEEKHLLMIRYLLGHGINIHLKDNKNQTALDYAKDSNNQMIFDLIHYKLLLEKIKK